MTLVLLCADYTVDLSHRACKFLSSFAGNTNYQVSLISPSLHESTFEVGKTFNAAKVRSALTKPAKRKKAKGSEYIGNKRAEDQMFDVLKDLLPDVLFSFDFFSLAVCARIQKFYRQKGHRCLWFHDQFEGIGIHGENLDNFQKLRTQTLTKFLLQTDACTTFTETVSQFLYTNYRLPTKPIVLPDFASKSVLDNLPTLKKSGNGSTSKQKHIVFTGPSQNRAFLKAIIKIVCVSDVLYIFENDSTVQESIRNLVRSTKVKKTNIRFLPLEPGAIRPILPKGSDAVIIDGAAGFEVKSSDYILSMANTQKITAFLPKSSNSIQLKKRFPNVSLKIFDPLSLPDFDLKALASFVSANRPQRRRKIETRNVNWDTKNKRTILKMVDEYMWRLDKREPVKPGTDVRDLRVLHGLTGAAGQPWMLSRAQRQLGMLADTFVADGNKFAYRSDKTILEIDFDALAGLIKSHSPNYDVFQFYFRSYFFNKITLSFPTAMDLLALKAAGKRIIFYFMGSEIRFHSMYKEFSPFNYVDENPGNVANFPEETQRRLFSVYSAIADRVAVSDPEMESYVPGTPIIERAIDLDEWPISRQNRKKRPLIVHAPSRQVVKGSASVIAALESLKEQGLDFDFQMIENLPQDEARELYKKADVVVDQMRIGWYGFLSVEAMALGKAVVCYIRDDLIHNFGSDGPPMAVANPDTIEDVLRKLIENPQLRQVYGAKGRQFVENVHDKEIVAKKFLDLYQDAVDEPGDVDISVVAKFMIYQTNYANAELNRLRNRAG